jgi:hypothetical protein
MNENDLGEWIRQKMTVDDNQILNENKDIISTLVGLSPEGKVMLKVVRERFNGRQIVLLYLVGKLYSKVAGYSQERSASNSEIINETGLPSGTVGRCLLELHKQGYVRDGSNGGHELVPSSIPSILASLKDVK